MITYVVFYHNEIINENYTQEVFKKKVGLKMENKIFEK